MRALCAEMATTAQDLAAVAGLAEVGESLDAGIAALELATDWLLAHRGADSLAGATAYLRLAGDVIGGWVLGRQALAAVGETDPRLVAKAPLARLYAAQVLAQAPGVARGVMQGAVDLEAVSAEALAG
jgi:hypothetical protein